MTKVVGKLLIYGVMGFMHLGPAMSADCKQVLSVPEIARNGAKLDGRTICARGKLVPSAIPQWNAGLLDELLPLSRKPIK